MKKIIAKRLQKGDLIGIVSPSAPVEDKFRKAFNTGVDWFKQHGFRVKIASNALGNSLGYSASAQEKASDINEMFSDKEVKAIICSQGGQNANSILPYLDYELIKNNPKVFLGISDITVLLNTLYLKTGLITFHGNDVMWGFGREHEPYNEQEFFERLIEGKIGVINKNRDWKCVREGVAEGKLIGGNLHCMLKLAGTEYFPDLNDAILFLEDFGEEGTPGEVNQLFHQLKQIGGLEKIKGLWLGFYKTKSKVQIEDIAQEVVADYDFPILQCDDFGHNTPNTTIPIGIKAKLDATNCEVELLEPCVK